MTKRRLTGAIGLLVGLGLTAVLRAAPDADIIPPAAVVLPPPALTPATPPPPAGLGPAGEPARPAAEPKPAVVTPAPAARSARYDYSGIPSYDSSRPLWMDDALGGVGDVLGGVADVLHDHLRIGVRYRRISLDDDSRDTENSFLGSITELNTLSDYEPITWFTFDWLFVPYVGVRLSWEQVRAETRTQQTTTSLNHSDGDLDVFGPSLMLLLRYPNEYRIVPTVGIGYAWLSADFEHNPVWHNGFGGENREAQYQAWVDAGSPPWPNNGYQRSIVPDDTTALILYGELAVQLTDHVDIYGFVQSMDVDGVDIAYELSFYGNAFRTERAEFPMSNTAYGAGLRWTF